MNQWIGALGPVGWPLLAVSITALAVIVERCFFILQRVRLRWSRTTVGISKMVEDGILPGDAPPSLRHSLLAEGVGLLLDHRGHDRNTREELVSLWLVEQRGRVEAHLKWLALVAVISPLLGLLGTVMGMIESFQSLASHAGPVTPALLASGLQQAMLTTAAGLAIALPALVALHLFRMWGEHYLTGLANVLNRVQLALEGVALDHNAHSAVTDTGVVAVPRESSS